MSKMLEHLMFTAEASLLRPCPTFMINLSWQKKLAAYNR